MRQSFVILIFEFGGGLPRVIYGGLGWQTLQRVQPLSQGFVVPGLRLQRGHCILDVVGLYPIEKSRLGV
jgi:hypothetical protein